MTSLFRNILWSFAAIALAATGIVGMSFAAGGEKTRMEHIDWGFNGVFGKYDRLSMQRGYQVYREICAACHSLDHLSFRHLGDRGGPFYDKDNPDPIDNPVVKALARDWTVGDIDQDTGDLIDRLATPVDNFPQIFVNEPEARASNGGTLPPDLSIIVKARSGGADYLYGILTGYKAPPRDMEMSAGMSYNTVFDGNQIAMAPPLTDGIIEYATRTIVDHGETRVVAPPEVTVEQMSRDVVEFLAWAADPKMEMRKKLGLATMIFLFIFSILLYLTYREVWRNVKP